MIQTSPTMRIFAAIEPADFRNGIDGLTVRTAAREPCTVSRTGRPWCV